MFPTTSALIKIYLTRLLSRCLFSLGMQVLFSSRTGVLLRVGCVFCVNNLQMGIICISNKKNIVLSKPGDFSFLLLCIGCTNAQGRLFMMCGTYIGHSFSMGI